MSPPKSPVPPEEEEEKQDDLDDELSPLLYHNVQKEDLEDEAEAEDAVASL
jgi:hypothetical protein